MSARAALLVAHPGHEVALHGWLWREKPTVFVLTAGKDGLDATRTLLGEAGARAGGLFGRFAERQIYAALLGHDTGFFTDVAEALVAEFERGGFDMAVGDALEGLSATHDAWRCVIDAAVERTRRAGTPLRSYEYGLLGHPGRCPPELESRAIRVTLDEDEFQSKLAAARAEKANANEVRAILERDASAVLAGFPDLLERVAPMLEDLGPEALRVECLRPAKPFAQLESVGEPPLWELYGEHLVERGEYPHVLRWHEHLLPVGRALRSWAGAPHDGSETPIGE